METQLNFFSILKLEEIALRKSAVAFYMEPGILALVAKFRLDSKTRYVEEWMPEECLRNVKDLLSKLHFPESLKKRIKPILEAVGSEILKWKLFHQEYLNDLKEDVLVCILKKTVLDDSWVGR